MVQNDIDIQSVLSNLVFLCYHIQILLHAYLFVMYNQTTNSTYHLKI